MWRDPLNIVIVVVLAALVVIGGPVALEKIRGPQAPEGSIAAMKPAANERRVTLRISGMMCGNCVESITNSLNSTAGVTGADVDLASGKAIVLCEKTVADSALVGAVVRSGGHAEYKANVTAF